MTERPVPAPLAGAPFVCPVCRGALAEAGGSLCCERRHTYDVARQGYVNLLRKKPDTLYEEKALFEARRVVYGAGFFAPVVEAVREGLPEGTVLDAGCGEGSLLAALTADGVRRGIGLDIAKPAVQMAAGAYKQAAWCVGDLCDIPLPDGAVEAIVNVLTPANYGEFSRVLAPGGSLVKVVPSAAHLQEIRSLTNQSPYTHALEETIAILKKRFALLEQKTIRYTVFCDEALAAAVYAMTPLTAHVLPCSPGAGEITVDVTALYGVPLVSGWSENESPSQLT